MAGKQTYAQEKAARVQDLTRDLLNELPIAVVDFILSIQETTQPLTRYGYAHDIRLFLNYLHEENPKFGDRPLMEWTKIEFEQIATRDFNLFMDYLTSYMDDNENIVTNHELGKMRKLGSLRSFFKFMFREHIVSSNVSELIETPKRHEKPILRLEIDEMTRMLDVAENGIALSEGQKKYHTLTKKRDIAMISLFLGTGIRVSECVGLDLDDIDFEINGFLVTRKGGNQVILYLPDEVIPVLKDYIEERRQIVPINENENALFLSLQKRRMSVRAVENMVKKYAAVAAPLKKRISPHKLRSTFGTNLYNETGDIYLVADVLGHSDVNTTRRHYAAMDENRRRMAATKVKLRTENSNSDDTHTEKRR